MRKLRILLEAWSVKIISLLVVIAGFINTISAVFPALSYRHYLLSQVFSGQIIHAARIGTALSGFFLLIISLGLWRKKQVAWIYAIIILVLAIIGNLLKGLDIEEASYFFVLLVALLYLRPSFQAKSDSPSVKNGIYILIIAVLFVLSYGTIGFYFLDKHFQAHFGFFSSLLQTLKILSGDNPVNLASTRFGHFFINSIPAVAFVALGYGLIETLKPIAKTISNENERNKAKQIINRYGDSPLANFALFPDKSYFIFNNSVISYSIIGRTAHVLGDPIGEKEYFQKTINEFVHLCTRNDWRPIFYSIEDKSIYEECGLTFLSIGDEASVDLESFTLVGHEKKKLRSCVNRLKSQGYMSEVLEAPLNDMQLLQLRNVSDEWLENKNGREGAFSFGHFDKDYLRNSNVIIARDRDGNVCAFANIIVIDKKKEIGIDLMRRRIRSENGIMEFLFTELFSWAKGKGYSFCNLGLSPLANVGTKSGDLKTEKFLSKIYQNVNIFYNFKGLHRFKEKFGPQWSKRYLAYSKSANPVAVGAAIIKAHQDEIFPRDLAIKLGKYLSLCFLVLFVLFMLKVLAPPFYPIKFHADRIDLNTSRPIAISKIVNDKIDFPNQGKRNVLIYLPKGYNPADKNTKYPVYYLLHGSPGKETDWVESGGMKETLDQKINDGSIVPLIVVCPDGNGGILRDTQFIDSTDKKELNETFIAHTVVNYIDNNFNTKNSPEWRAIGGLSSGGFGAINIGLKHQDIFGLIISYDGYGNIEKNVSSNSLIQDSQETIDANSPSKYIPSLNRHQVKILLVSGKNDVYSADNKQLYDELISSGFNANLSVQDGWHLWIYWKKYFAQSLPWLNKSWGNP